MVWVPWRPICYHRTSWLTPLSPFGLPQSSRGPVHVPKFASAFKDPPESHPLYSVFLSWLEGKEHQRGNMHQGLPLSILPEAIICLFWPQAYELFPALFIVLHSFGASHMAQVVKNLSVVQETQVWSLDWKGPLEKGLATHSSILASFTHTHTHI